MKNLIIEVPLRSLSFFFFFSSRRRHTRFDCDWSSDVCSSDLLLCLGALATLAAGQEMTGFDRQRAHLMLRAAEQDLRDHYYDTTFHGLDLRTLFDSTDARIAAAHSNDEAFLSIAVTLGALRDSHTHFFPPRRNAVVQYGWNLGIVGAPATSSK